MGRLSWWLKRALSSRHAPLAVVVIAIVVSLPTLPHGISADDYWHELAFTNVVPEWAPMKNQWWDLFRFFDGGERNVWLRRTGLAPWWIDPSVRMVLFRPLSCATHLFDYVVWPNTPWLMHVHSIAWYAALAAVARWTYRRLFARLGDGAAWIANLAAVMYVVDYSHGIPIAWLANRNALIAAVFAIASLGVHDVASVAESRSARARASALSGLLFLFGLFSGESALAVGAYLAVHALWLDDRSTKARVVSLLPHLAAAIVWVIAYRSGGFGAKGSGMYTEPLREPLLYSWSVLQCLPLLVASELGGPPPDLYVFSPPSMKVAMLAMAVAFLAWASFTLVRVYRSNALAKALVVGSMLAVLPGCATFPSGRLLMIPSFGLMGIVAVALAGRMEDAAWIPERGAPRALVRSFAWWVGFGHLFFCPLALQVSAMQMPIMAQVIHRFAAGMPTTEPVPERVVIVNAPDPLFVTFVLAETKIGAKSSPARMLILAGGQRDLTVTRESVSTLVVEQNEGFYRGGTEVILRKVDTPMPVGTRVDLGDVDVEVRETMADGVPKIAAFHFTASPEDPSKYSFRWWDGNGLVPFPLPAVGESSTVKGRMMQLTP